MDFLTGGAGADQLLGGPGTDFINVDADDTLSTAVTASTTSISTQASRTGPISRSPERMSNMSGAPPQTT